MDFEIKKETPEAGNKNIIISGKEDCIREVEITSIKFDVSGRSGVLKVDVLDEYGQKGNGWFYEPTLKQGIADAQEKYKNAQKNYTSILANIARRFLGKDYLTTKKFSSVKEFSEQVIADIGDKFVGKKVRAIFVIDYRGFTSLRKYSPVFEDISVPIAETTLIPRDKDYINNFDNGSGSGNFPAADKEVDTEEKL